MVVCWRTIWEENFQGFRIGNFPYDQEHSAMGEYHYYPAEGYSGRWYTPNTSYDFRGPNFIITEKDGKKYMEVTRIQRPQIPITMILSAGDNKWSDYRVEVALSRLSQLGRTGIMVRYIHALAHYLVYFENGRLVLAKREFDVLKELAGAPFDLPVLSEVRLNVVCEKNRITCHMDGHELISVEDDSYPAGKIAIFSDYPARYSFIGVYMTDAAARDYEASSREYALRISEKRAKYPQPRLWKSLDLHDFGAGRQVRFGHLTGDDTWHIVFAQHQKRCYGDAYANISCLTAVNLDGNVLWQIGTPSSDPDHAYLTADLPFQICDIDGDGFEEVIYARDFELIIADGRTGKTKKTVRTPHYTDSAPELQNVPFDVYAFEYVNVDSIRIANFSGKTYPSDILIKDRYNRIWVYDNNLQLKWTFKQGNTGHFPYTCDINGDGYDEMVSCYNLVDKDGNLIWSLPVDNDHADEIIAGRLHPEEDPVIAMVCGSEGFMLVGLDGKIKVKHWVGHAQRISAGRFRANDKGLCVCVCTYWEYQGIVLLYDYLGRLCYQSESEANGNTIAPVNWMGDGTDLIFLTGNSFLGGLMDGDGDIVVALPADGHPDTCCEIIDLTGDTRDEIVLWDKDRMHIYTQSDSPKDDIAPPPIKYPHCNASNYRGEYSFSSWNIDFGTNNKGGSNDENF